MGISDELYGKISGTHHDWNFQTLEQVLNLQLLMYVLCVSMSSTSMQFAARHANQNSALSVIKITTVETHSTKEHFTRNNFFFKALLPTEYVDGTLEIAVRGNLLN
jgi:hypothetical protein